MALMLTSLPLTSWNSRPSPRSRQSPRHEQRRLQPSGNAEKVARAVDRRGRAGPDAGVRPRARDFAFRAICWFRAVTGRKGDATFAEPDQNSGAEPPILTKPPPHRVEAQAPETGCTGAVACPAWKIKNAAGISHDESRTRSDARLSELRLASSGAAGSSGAGSTKFAVADIRIACSGLSARVETDVAIALAVSWKPLM